MHGDCRCFVFSARNLEMVWHTSSASNSSIVHVRCILAAFGCSLILLDSDGNNRVWNNCNIFDMLCI